MKNQLQIYAVRLPGDISGDCIEALCCQVTPQKQAKAKSFVKKADALRSLTAELLLCRVALPAAGVNEDCPVFSYNEYGKPSLANQPDVYFNLAHAGNIVVCVVDSDPVGIDVEEIKPVEAKVAQYCFTQDELCRLAAGQEQDRLRNFYDLWTIKESYLKAIGRGLSLPMNSFTVAKKEIGQILVLPSAERWFFRQYEIDSGYALALCALHDNFPADVLWVDIAELCKLNT